MPSSLLYLPRNLPGSDSHFNNMMFFDDAADSTNALSLESPSIPPGPSRYPAGPDGREVTPSADTGLLVENHFHNFMNIFSEFFFYPGHREWFYGLLATMQKRFGQPQGSPQRLGEPQCSSHSSCNILERFGQPQGSPQRLDVTSDDDDDMMKLEAWEPGSYGQEWFRQPAGSSQL